MIINIDSKVCVQRPENKSSNQTKGKHASLRFQQSIMVHIFRRIKNTCKSNIHASECISPNWIQQRGMRTQFPVNTVSIGFEIKNNQFVYRRIAKWENPPECTHQSHASSQTQKQSATTEKRMRLLPERLPPPTPPHHLLGRFYALQLCFEDNQ